MRRAPALVVAARRCWRWCLACWPIFCIVATGRTALVIIPVLLVLFAAKKLNAKGIAILFAGVIVVGCRRLVFVALFARSHDAYLDRFSKI